MRVWFRYPLLVAAAVVLLAQPAFAGKVLDRVVRTDTLRVGMSGDQPPLNVIARDGATIGLEADLARLIAFGMGVELQIVNMPFAELEPALKKGKIDMIMSGMSITPERARSMAFIGPYMMSGKSLVTRAGLLEEADETGDIDSPAVSIAVLGRSTSESFVREYAPSAKVVAVANYEEGVRKLLDGEVAAMVADMPACAFALLRHPDAGLIALDEPLQIEPIGIAVDARDAEFRNLLQNYVDVVRDSELGAGLSGKWFDDDEWLSLLP